MKDMERLIRKAQDRDPRAFEQLYRMTAREIGWYCKRLCGNEFDAQDLMQEVWLTAWQKLPQYSGMNFPAWLRSVAHNTFLNRLKKYRLELLTEELPEMPPEDELLGPVHIAEQRELRRILLHTIDTSLPTVQRMTVLLYYYDDLSVGEIAARMECSEGTVKSRLYHARKKLREALPAPESMLYGVPCVLPLLRYEAVHAGRTAPFFFSRYLLPSITDKAVLLSVKAAAAICAAAVLTAAGTALALHRQPEQPAPVTELTSVEVTAISDTSTRMTEPVLTSELAADAPVSETAEASATETTPEMAAAASTSEAFTEPTSAEPEPVSLPDTEGYSAQTAAAGSASWETEHTASAASTETTTLPTAATTLPTEPPTEPETVPLPAAPVLMGFAVDVWEEDAVVYARITPEDTEVTTTRIKLLYSLAQPPQGYTAPVTYDPRAFLTNTDNTLRTVLYAQSDGEDVLQFTQRTRNAASPLLFGERFILGDYDLTAVSVGVYPGWLAVSKGDPADCTLEWDVGEYLFTITAKMSDPDSLLTAARNLMLGG